MADSAATTFDAAATCFAVEPPNFRRARRLGRVPLLRLDQGGFDQLRESLLRIAAILFLAALCACNDQHGAFVGETAAREAP